LARVGLLIVTEDRVGVKALPVHDLCRLVNHSPKSLRRKNLTLEGLLLLTLPMGTNIASCSASQSKSRAISWA
jgi:hypothetical protein